MTRARSDFHIGRVLDELIVNHSHACIPGPELELGGLGCGDEDGTARRMEENATEGLDVGVARVLAKNLTGLGEQVDDRPSGRRKVRRWVPSFLGREGGEDEEHHLAITQTFAGERDRPVEYRLLRQNSSARET